VSDLVPTISGCSDRDPLSTIARTARGMDHPGTIAEVRFQAKPG